VQGQGMKSVRSKDGTQIAFDQYGSGPNVILVDGALCHRGFGPMPSIGKLLAPHFTVFHFDRRGRGQSGDTPPYSVDREIEDIEAMIGEAGGSAYLFGASSGAALALEAASRLRGIKKIALYEAPFFFDDAHPPRPDNYVAKLTEMAAANRRGDALKLFMKTVGTPGFAIAIMQLMPMWSKLKAVAHTLRYDMTIVSDKRAGEPLSARRWSTVTMPALTAVGSKSPGWWQDAMQQLSRVLPNSQHRVLAGQTHMVKAQVLAPVLQEFFAS
jgi:pimeloyl-ACP methyl ester carboxylesterase